MPSERPGQHPRKQPAAKGNAPRPRNAPAPRQPAAPVKKRPAPKQPPGPNFAQRRLIVLGAALGLVALLVWGVFALVGWFHEMLAPEPNEAANPAVSTAQPVACGNAELTWTLVPNGSLAGRPVDFQWTVTNLSDLACTIDAAPTSVSFSVVSGSDDIWSSADCGSSEPFLLLLGPGDSTTQTTRWEGGRSAPGCAAASGSVRPGTYQANVNYLGQPATGATAVFALE